MEKRKQGKGLLEDQLEISKTFTADYETNHLLQLIPKSIKAKFSESKIPNESLYNCIKNFHTHPKIEELHSFFIQIGADEQVWMSKISPDDKAQYLLNSLEKNVQQSLKKINYQTTAYVNSIVNAKRAERAKTNTEKQKANDFDWLVLNTKNQMLKSKLKTKLVQTINQFKNQKKLRDVMGKQLQQHEKIHLQDQSIDLYQDQKSKINYEWTSDDEQMFLKNIQKLKEKFTQTQFLKNCHRYKFITYHELKTLASEQISRKLDKSNKAFLSRQFLLDKYFSTKQNLTQKQMKFILKTSPLLSKCVDKAFVRAAIKNIQYDDIDRMQLQIAEQIIQKFQTIRNLVKNSRKIYKQKQNNRAKTRIQMFEKTKNYEKIRACMNESFQKHKVKMIRNLNYRPATAINSKQVRSNKENGNSKHENFEQISQKMVWPIPLNNYHPSTGLFIRDCSQQINDQFNDYEKSYLKGVFNSQNQNYIKKNQQSQAAMIKFYTGGPLQSYSSTNRKMLSSSSSQFKMVPQQQTLPLDTIKVVCQAFKTTEYRKELLEKLNAYDGDDDDYDERSSDRKTLAPSTGPVVDFCLSQATKKTKKSLDNLDQQGFSANKAANSTEKAIKQKLLQGRQKAKMAVYVKKLLSLAAENSFLSLKALNAKFTVSQINTVDSKGNTALFYATKHKNSDFIDYLLSQKADVNIKCSKGSTALHNAFKSSNYSIICKCLSGAVAPNLNALDDDNKTPLAYCCRKVLQMLGLQEGVVSVAPGEKIKFNNNSLLYSREQGGNTNDELEMRQDIRRKDGVKESGMALT